MSVTLVAFGGVIASDLACCVLNKFLGYGYFFFFQAEDGIRDDLVTGVQTCALPIFGRCIDVQEHIMALAVLLDAVRQAAQAPIFLLLDPAAFAFDDGLEMGGQCVHLDRKSVV